MTAKRLALFSTLVLAAACGGGSTSSGDDGATTQSTTTEGDESSTGPHPEVVVGGDRDEHGCIGSAGYSWCEREHACVRSWELASERGFEVSAENFAQYCAGH